MNTKILILTLILLFLSCKKEDFRDKYVGKYCCDYGGCVTIEKIEDNGYDNLLFTNFNGYGRVYLNENGKFSNIVTSHTLEGYFVGDSLYYKFAYNHDPIPSTYSKCVKK